MSSCADTNPGSALTATGRTDPAIFEQAMAQSDFLIVPSEGRVGPIRVGMLLDEVVTTLGPPHSMSNYPQAIVGVEPGFAYYYDGGNFRVGFTPGAVPRVTQIEVFDPRFSTDRGIRIGTSTLFEVERTYGTPKEMKRYHIYYEAPGTPGLVFQREKQGYRVDLIVIWQ